MYVPHHNTEARRVDLQMTPMIDVVFLLLIFFILTASFQKPEESLPTNLTLAQSRGAAQPPKETPEEEFEDVVVRIIAGDGGVSWRIGESAYRDLRDVGGALRLLAEKARDELPVIIDSDGDVPLAAVVDVYDVCRTAGFAEINFAAEAPQK